MGRARRIAVIAAALALTFTGNTAAHAATTVASDPRGDSLWPRYDLTRVSYDNTSDRLRVVARVVDLRPGWQTFGVNLFRPTVDDTYYQAETTLHRDGRASGSVRDGDTGEKVSCRVRGRWKRDRDKIVLTVQAGCFGPDAGRTFRIQSYFGSKRHGDPADQTRSVRVLAD